jgi:endonuclease III
MPHRRDRVCIHLQRIDPPLGIAREHIPEAAMLALQRKLPKEYWWELHRLLVSYHGRTAAEGRQVGVTEHGKRGAAACD